jgi:alpha-glucosidase
MELDIVEWRLVLTCPAHQVSERRDAQGNLLAVLTWSISARYPVLIPNVDSVNGVFPGIGEGTRWYDW